MNADEVDQRIISECLIHSKDLISGAEKVVEEHPYIAYHLAALALEEIGKCHVIKMRKFARSENLDESAYPKNILDDHTKKLFWALWAPSIGSEVLTGQQINDYKGLASHIHNKRINSLYVPIGQNDFINPREIIVKEEAIDFISLVKARISTEMPDVTLNLNKDKIELVTWFEGISSDSENRKFIWGIKSMEMLAEFKSIHKWITWLKEQFDQNSEENKALVLKEIHRQRPTQEEEDHPKWAMKIAIQCESHSLRKKALNYWNEHFPKTIKFSFDEKNRKTIYIEVVLPKKVHGLSVYNIGLRWAQRVVLSMNIGTLGFFWWYLPKNRAKYYETLTDLENKTALEVLREPPLKIDWGKNRALDDEDMIRTAVCFACLPHEDQTAEWEPFNYYLQALAFLAKNDIHMQFEPTIFNLFMYCLSALAKKYGDWDGKGKRSVILKKIAEHFPEFDEVEQFSEISDLIEEQKPLNVDKVKLEDVSKLKIVVDYYIMKQFKKILPSPGERN
jgi:AbiV family abortive infection protein